MHSQQLPKSAKVDTLPPADKELALRLIREKFGIKEEKPKKAKKETVTVRPDDMIRMVRCVWTLRPVDRSRSYPQRYDRGFGYDSSYMGFRGLPTYIQQDFVEGTDPSVIATWLVEELGRLESKFGVIFQARPEGSKEQPTPPFFGKF